MLTRKNISIIAALAAGIVVGCQAPSAHAQWTGCGVGALGAFTAAVATEGDPIGLGTIAPSAGALVNCDYKAGAFVIGGEATYRYFMGDMKQIGFNTDWGVNGRVGVLLSPTSLLGVRGGWGQIDTDYGNLSNWRVGLFNEFRIPNSPIYLDLRADYVTYNLGDLNHHLDTVDANALEVGIALKVKLGPGAFGGKGEVIDTTVPCDPKFANCKR